MTGIKAGKRGADGSFEPGSFNDLVQKRLMSQVEILRRLSSHDGEALGAGLLPEGEPAMAAEEEEEPEKKPRTRKRGK
jgi:hypothetical protein